MLLGVGAVVLLLLIGGSAYALWHYYLRASGPNLAEVLPQETELYAEVPNVRAAALALAKARFLKSSARDEESLIGDESKAVAESFGIDESTAKTLALATHSVGFGAHGLSGAGNPAGSLVVRFDAASPVDKLLASKRFTSAGSVGKEGKTYRLSSASGAPPVGTGRAALLRHAFDALQTSSVDELAWWPNAKVLALGPRAELEAMAAVIDGTKPSLSKSVRFTNAVKKVAADSVGLGWVDGKALAAAMSHAGISEIAVSEEGVIAGVTADEAGTMFRLIGTLTGPWFSRGTLLEDSGELTYPARLPAETFVYLAGCSHSSLDGAARYQQMLQMAGDQKGSAQQDLAEASAKLQQATGVSLPDAIGAIGEEIVIGALAAPGFKLGSMEPSTLQQFGAFAAIKIKNKAVAEQLLTQLRDKVLAPELGEDLQKLGTGFRTPIPAGPGLIVDARLVGDQLLVTGGSAVQVERAIAAFGGAGPFLGDEPAHRRSLEAMPKKLNHLLWVDTGRVGQALLDGMPSLAAMSKEAGISPEELTLAGPDRVTSTWAGVYSKQPNGWAIDQSFSNLPYALLVVGGVAAGSASSALGGLAVPGAGLGGPSLGTSGQLGAVPSMGGAAPSDAGTCAQAVRCCTVLMEKTGNAAQAAQACGAFASLGDGVCAQALDNYKKGVKALGASCD